MENYKPNSHKSKAESTKSAEKKEIKKVVTETKVKKKSGMSKLAGNFISDDAKNVKSYVIMDVLIPAMKKAISDIVTNGIDMILYGETGRTKRTGSTTYVSYNKYSNKERSDERRYSSDRRYKSFAYEDIVIENRGEAENVLSMMLEILDNYEHVSVNDLNDLLGISGDFTDTRYGWTSLRTADIRRIRDGYILDLPAPRVID